jgi:general secretion pathway protein K
MKSQLQQKQYGAAFITAILIMAVASIIGVAISERMQLSIRRTGNLIHHDAAYQYNLGGENWASLILLRDLDDDSRNGYIDSNLEFWATPLPETFIDGGSIVGRITDSQGKFNLNNIILDQGTDSVSSPVSPSINYFRRLLQQLEIDPDLVYTLYDWLDTNNEITYPNGAEDDTYKSFDPPYLTANRLIVDPSELRMIKGFSAEITDKLLPYVTALPVFTELNINTAQRMLLLSLDDTFTPDIVDTIIQYREQNSFSNKSAFLDFVNNMQLDEQRPANELPTLIGVSSNYFLINSRVKKGDTYSSLSTVVFRSKTGIIKTLIRSRGLT